MLGIVGRSGMGKSTLVSLISRLYDPDSGQVLIDGHDLKDLTFDSLKGTVAMVSQESYIFMGSVAENIAYAKPGASKEEILAAAAAAGAHGFICKFPDGYDTLIGSGGRQLSGGERQRLSLCESHLPTRKYLFSTRPPPPSTPPPSATFSLPSIGFRKTEPQFPLPIAFPP